MLNTQGRINQHYTVLNHTRCRSRDQPILTMFGKVKIVDWLRCVAHHLSHNIPNQFQTAYNLEHHRFQLQRRGADL